jgi:hypothetical protein
MWKKIVIIICIIIIIYAAINKPTKIENFEEKIAVMSNQFIQTNDQNGANNIDNTLSANFIPDNMGLRQFFYFDDKIAKYYPQSKNIVNNFNVVPRVI